MWSMSHAKPLPARAGTQSIERAVYLLRELALRGARGWGLRDLAAHCGLEVATVHRILKCLVAEGLVQQRASDQRYLLGLLNFELGLSVHNRSGFVEVARQTVRRVARQFPKTVSAILVRSGDDCVCVARGGSASFSSAAVAILEGQRRPLLARLSGMAIVAMLPEQEAQAIFERGCQRMAHFGEAYLDQAHALMQACRQQGYALSIGTMLHRVNSLSVPFGAAGAPIGALAVSALSSDYDVEGLQAMLPRLQDCVRVLAAQAPAA